MNILFLTISRFGDINSRGIYTDLMRELIRLGNKIYIASPVERRFGENTHLIESDNCKLLKIKTLNIQKTNVIEKGIGTLLLEWQFDRAICKYWGSVKFDLVLYSTPPITFNRVIERVKKRCGCRSYLMLKDIFPQNAVDLGMMKAGGMLHKMFRKKEKLLYKISDKIGCMSPANCEYVLKNNPEVSSDKVELCPNAIEIKTPEPISDEERKQLLESMKIPIDKKIFIYGGNLGKPQGVDFLLRVVEANEKRVDSFIIIVGSGTAFPKISNWFSENNPVISKLLGYLPKNEYDKLVCVADVGLIFLDPRFTIPNFPSRLLSYLENSIPVLLATDRNTDIGIITEREGFGFWCESGDLDSFLKNMDLISCDISTAGVRGYQFLVKNYSVKAIAPNIINACRI